MGLTGINMCCICFVFSWFNWDKHVLHIFFYLFFSIRGLRHEKGGDELLTESGASTTRLVVKVLHMSIPCFYLNFSFNLDLYRLFYPLVIGTIVIDKVL